VGSFVFIYFQGSALLLFGDLFEDPQFFCPFVKFIPQMELRMSVISNFFSDN